MKIVLDPNNPALDSLRERLARLEKEVSDKNKLLFQWTRRPSGPHDIQVGDKVIPNDEQWRRGFGRVLRVEGWCVLVFYGPRPGGTEPVTCCSPWNELLIGG